MEPTGVKLSYYVAIVKRRMYFILGPWLLVSVAAFFISSQLPRSYRSFATMLIEAPRVLNTLVELPVSDQGRDQVQSLTQRVMTTENISKLIVAYNLYSNQGDARSNSELVDFFRKNADISLANSAAAPSHSDLTDIVFTISFVDNDPSIAFQITKQLADLFIEKNISERTRHAIRATDFLEEESDKLNSQIQSLDARIARYKEEFGSSLPEILSANYALIEKTESDQKDVENKLAAIQERITVYESELAKVESTPAPTNPAAEAGKDSRDLSQLRTDYLRALTRYRPNHPDVLRLRRQLQRVDPAFISNADNPDVEGDLDIVERDLQELRERYSEEHPDVIRKREEIRLIKRRPDSGASDMRSGPLISQSNPTALTLIEAQYKGTVAERGQLLKRLEEIKTKREELRSRVANTPKVEIAYQDLLRERENTIKKFSQFREKLLDAKVAQTMEVEQQGQTISIIEKPTIPEHPEKSLRSKIVILGFLGGLGLGLGTAVLAEMLDARPKGYDAFVKATGMIPLAVIPYIDNTTELEAVILKSRQRRRIIMISLIGFMLFLTSIAILYFFDVHTTKIVNLRSNPIGLLEHSSNSFSRRFSVG